MRNRKWVWALIVGMISSLGVSTARAANPDGTGFHLPIGFTYTQGPENIDDEVKKGYEADGYTYDSWVWPVGLSLQPYVDFKLGPGNLGIGGSIGPFMIGVVDDISLATYDYSYYSVLPLGLDVRYTFFPTSPIAPYVRGGFRYPLAFGDLVDSGNIGAFGAVGVEFFRTNAVFIGLEAAYDGSEVDVTVGSHKSTAKLGEFMATLFIGFSF